jgi:glycosyltransferase involved in cell wall biosynthesis
VKVAVHIDQLWFDSPGGIGTYVRELVLRALEETDPTLELVPFYSRWPTSVQGVPYTIDGKPPGVQLSRSIRSLYPSWDRLGRPRLPKTLDDCAIVHATNHAAVPPVRGEQRLVVTVHDLAFDRFPDLFPAKWRQLYRWGTRAAVERAHAILVPSTCTKDDLIGGYKADPDRIVVTPLGASTARYGADQLASMRADADDYGIHPPYVLAVGTIEPRKNLVRLIRAFRQLRAEGLPQTLVLAGERGWAAGEVEAELERGGNDGVLVVGALSGSELDVAYMDADAVAYVSLYEGFGLPVVEAMGMGAPVVASNTSAIPEVAGDAAILVDPTDEGAIAVGLRRVLTDHALADDLRRRGKERAASYTWAATARATLDVYRRVTGAS